MVKKLFALFFCFYAGVVCAACPLADVYLKTDNKKEIFNEHKACARQLNNFESQFYIGTIYLNGTDYAKQNLRMAYKYFRMSAENGYAPAQRELAKLIDALEDMGPDGKQALDELENRWAAENNSNREPLSALAWMMLAAERAENKWFYNAPAIADEQAISLLASFKKGNTKQAEQQAVAFKQEKLMQQAKRLLSDSAYRDFESVIYPEKQKKSVPIQMTKAQAIENLKKYKMSIKK